jgi:coenzyme F420-reducing hydrogenase beta subunit
MNVCDHVVSRGLCIGCGVCAAVCPRRHLRIDFNSHGQYNAFPTDAPCAESCDLCLQVCPFSDSGEDEDALAAELYAGQAEIKHKQATGYCRGSYVGFSEVDGHRSDGSSGGLATWLLETLLDEDRVDYALCVSAVSDADRLFDYTVCSSPAEVRCCSRSCYYPVETSRVIRHVLEHEGRYAITALPCVAKAIRRAQKRLPKLRERIRYVLGLVCGQGKSAFFVEYVCALGGGDPHCLRGVTFRIKDPSRPASDYGMRFLCGREAGDRQEGTVFWKEGMGNVWGDRCFTPGACNFCDDVYAECADIVFMDAWLSRYARDPAGHNLVLTRDATLHNLLHRELDRPGILSLNRIEIDGVIKSQWGVAVVKRADLRRRIAWARKAGMPSIRKRDHLLKGLGPIGRNPLNRATWELSQRSGPLWTEVDKDKERFDAQTRKLREAADRARRHLVRFRRVNRLIGRLNRFFT